MTDFFQRVPKDFAGNLRYRMEIRERASHDAKFRAALVSACKNDVLFFFSAFCWLYEPRPRIINGVKMPPIIPFIPWEHQVPAIRKIKANLGFEDIGVEKSRGEGASWILILLALHDWLFDPLSAIGLVSNTENAVDNPDDPRSLFWKLDWELTKLPRWMAGVKGTHYKRQVAEHVLKNLRNGATITGYAATADVASGGRNKWFGMDELSKFPRGPDFEAMASTQHVTESRLVVSTPKGSEGAYHALMHEPSSMVKVVLDWQQNPSRNQGLYKLVHGVPVFMDPANPLAADYNPPTKEILDRLSRLRRKGFNLEGGPRSPWYDHECDRPGATPQNIAQELDRDYGGSMYRIYGADFVRKTDMTVATPRLRGILDYHPESLEPSFDVTEDGPVLLWCPLDMKNRPPRHPFVIAADISTGLGGSYTSNSVAQVIDMVTHEQVLEYATNTVDPSSFAEWCISCAKWFHNAFLAWEANGPGASFTKRVKDLHYPNVYYRTALFRRSNKKTKELGWWTDTKSKEAMFGELGRSVKQDELVIRSDLLAKECGQYVLINGKIEHIEAANTTDDSSKGQAHGDRVIAMAVALQALLTRPLSAAREEQNKEIPPYSMAARQQAYEDSQTEEGETWDSRSNADMVRSL